MKAIRISFMHMVKLMHHDLMLIAACIAPILAGIAVKFAVPFLEKMLIEWTGKGAILLNYYGLFDIFLAALTPVMFCFIVAMVILEEHDDHIASYLFITGLGRKGYMVSRLLLPSLLSFVVTMILLPLFCLTSLSVSMMILLALTSTLQGMLIALLIVTLSSNKLEGMAITKLSSIIILGAFVPYFVSGPIGYILCFLPSFWAGKAVGENNLLYMIPSVIIGFIWLAIFFRKFQKKI